MNVFFEFLCTFSFVLFQTTAVSAPNKTRKKLKFRMVLRIKLCKREDVNVRIHTDGSTRISTGLVKNGLFINLLIVL